MMGIRPYDHGRHSNHNPEIDFLYTVCPSKSNVQPLNPESQSYIVTDEDYYSIDECTLSKSKKKDSDAR